MHQTKKGNQRYFGMKAHLGVRQLASKLKKVTYGGDPPVRTAKRGTS